MTRSAASSSSPVLVSTHVGCAQDLVRDNGLVFEAGDVDDLAEKLGRALESGERLTEWGQRSREIIADYTYENATRGLVQALEHCLV